MHVRYKIALVTYQDILGFTDLIATRTAGESSRIIGIFQQSVEPTMHKTPLKAAYRIPTDRCRHSSDLCLVVRPLVGVEFAPPCSQLVDHLLHVVRVQARLVVDEGILIRLALDRYVGILPTFSL